MATAFLDCSTAPLTDQMGQSQANFTSEILSGWRLFHCPKWRHCRYRPWANSEIMHTLRELAESTFLDSLKGHDISKAGCLTKINLWNKGTAGYHGNGVYNFRVNNIYHIKGMQVKHTNQNICNMLCPSILLNIYIKTKLCCHSNYKCDYIYIISIKMQFGLFIQRKKRYPHQNCHIQCHQYIDDICKIL